MRSAIAIGVALVGRRPRSSTTNSSPPKRAIVSPGARARVSRGATCDQQLVAGGVAEAVVDELEVVEVEEARTATASPRRGARARGRGGRGTARGWAARSAGRAAPGSGCRPRPRAAGSRRRACWRAPGRSRRPLPRARARRGGQPEHAPAARRAPRSARATAGSRRRARYGLRGLAARSRAPRTSRSAAAACASSCRFEHGAAVDAADPQPPPQRVARSARRRSAPSSARLPRCATAACWPALRSSSASASLRSVMSEITPCHISRRARRHTSAASSRTQTIRAVAVA